MTDSAQGQCLSSMKKIKHGSIVGFEGKVWFRIVKGGKKSMTLLNRARQDGCGQPCVLIYEED